ncbi:hypothetical protein V1514DRAFT_137964 [Lipomyces japonicus]|uniref:uncharacterized protein n=1 Tax=Lipomyces japonicus TaxID=56871 RepID=UPI0034CD9D7D
MAGQQNNGNDNEIIDLTSEISENRRTRRRPPVADFGVDDDVQVTFTRRRRSQPPSQRRPLSAGAGMNLDESTLIAVLGGPNGVVMPPRSFHNASFNNNLSVSGNSSNITTEPRRLPQGRGRHNHDVFTRQFHDERIMQRMQRMQHLRAMVGGGFGNHVMRRRVSAMPASSSSSSSSSSLSSSSSRGNSVHREALELPPDWRFISMHEYDDVSGYFPAVQFRHPDWASHAAVAAETTVREQRAQRQALSHIPVPLAPRKGYSRRVRAGAKLVCPSCAAELGGKKTTTTTTAGEEENVSRDPNPNPDLQQTIWATVKCGHVYCGNCALKFRRMHQRRRGRSSKKIVRSEVVGKCMVKECDNIISGARGMFEIFV